jgi:hypothetical protein
MTFAHRRAFAGVALVSLGVSACSDQPTSPALIDATTPSFAVSSSDETAFSAYLASADVRAAQSGLMIAQAELLTTSTASVKTPRIIFANDRALRLNSGWVARDLRRLSTDATLSYAVFAPFAKASVGGAAEAAIDASMATWNSASCSKLAIQKRTLAPAQFPSFLLTGLFPPADINDVGFLPGALFDLAFGAGSSKTTIAITVTFSFIQVGPNGLPILDAKGNTIPSDVDGDGRWDTAFKEIWFNDALAYSTNGVPGTIDIESVALHEHGHALELGHFGKIAGDPKTGKLHVSPRAVMNAANLGTQRTLLGSDNAAFCGTYASWK